MYKCAHCGSTSSNVYECPKCGGNALEFIPDVQQDDLIEITLLGDNQRRWLNASTGKVFFDGNPHRAAQA